MARNSMDVKKYLKLKTIKYDSYIREEKNSIYKKDES